MSGPFCIKSSRKEGVAMSKSITDLAVSPMNLRTLFYSIAIFSLILTTQASADYVYDIVNYPEPQNGYTLSGQIVTDINSGTLSPANIVSWSWTVTGGVGAPFTSSSTDAGTSVTIIGEVDISAGSISIPTPHFTDSIGVLQFNDGSGADLGYGLTNTGIATTLNWSAAGPGGTGGSDIFWDVGPFVVPSEGIPLPWVVADAQSTPEPTTITLLASGFLAFGGFGLVRRRRRGRATEPTPAN
jgi:hypothetical protein